jgi:hypothetical protein
MSLPSDFSVALQFFFLVLYVVLFVLGVIMCFFGATSARHRRVVYFIALFVLTNFVVLPLCWVIMRSAPTLDDKLTFIVLSFVMTAFAWRISRLGEQWIIELYGALLGALLGLVVLAIVKSFTSVGWEAFVASLLAGGVAGWFLARYQYDFSKVIFFSMSGAATIAQSLLGLFELATERGMVRIATDKIFHFIFPVLYLIFSPFDWLQVIFWPLAALLFIAGVQVQCLRLRQTEPGAPPICERTAGRIARLLGRSRPPSGLR